MAANRGPSMTLGGVRWGPDRYPTLRVSEGGQRYYVPLHRLVAFAHRIIDHPRTSADPREVHHRDGDHFNNHPDNLEALSPAAHGRATRRGE